MEGGESGMSEPSEAAAVNAVEAFVPFGEDDVEGGEGRKKGAGIV